MMAGMNPGGAAAAASAADKDDGKFMDLSSLIDKKECFARNVAPGFPMTNLFIGDSRLGCKSDADEQLIIHISFHDFVKIKSIKFTEFNQGVDPDQNPTTVKLFVNRSNLGFEDIDDVDPTQVLTLTSEDLKEDAGPIMIKFVKFQRVQGLTIYIEDNEGAEQTALGALKLMGRPVQTTNMSDFKKGKEE
eukprot:CAMPEP_0119547584 /NCGR_PEP_ID=MMETSP1352-20130426/1662_1 /TAXON_ID=265584 /ORGANISM="Stauroneis constricta, Strain CCMP1120" /LENGTH=189 /DNA_ID=CAMNT_0007592533 /DNA_START=25 /DNA_END=594 /DNA_ORIENTATION=-